MNKYLEKIASKHGTVRAIHKHYTSDDMAHTVLNVKSHIDAGNSIKHRLTDNKKKVKKMKRLRDFDYAI